MAGKRRYTCDDAFFDVIDTEAKAYFLGILMTDGTVSATRPEVILELTDRDVVEQFKEAIQATNPIKTVHDNRPNRKPSYRLVLTSPRLKAALAALGCVPRKTHVLEFPHGKIPADLMRHFIRGVVDGDGSISEDDGNARIQITGNQPFLEGVDAQVAPLIRSTRTFSTRHPDRQNTIRTIAYSGNIKVGKLLAWLYRGARYAMQRKREVALNFLRRYYDKTPEAVVVVYEDCNSQLMHTAYSAADIDASHAPVIVTTLGFLMRDDSRGVTLYTEVHAYDGGPSWRGHVFIPRGQVLSVEVIRPAVDPDDDEDDAEAA